MSEFDEIEFKYLLANHTWRDRINRSAKLVQTYVNNTIIQVKCDLTNNEGQLEFSENGSVIGIANLPATMTEKMREIFEPETNLMDGYIVRLRLHGSEGDSAKQFIVICVKEMVSGPKRKEFEVQIDHKNSQFSTFKSIIDSNPEATIEKTRHYIEETCGEWEVDVFEGLNAGLVVAELEIEEKPKLTPSWIGDEVTDDEKYYNFSLLANPYKNW